MMMSNRLTRHSGHFFDNFACSEHRTIWLQGISLVSAILSHRQQMISGAGAGGDNNLDTVVPIESADTLLVAIPEPVGWDINDGCPSGLVTLPCV